MRVRSTYVEERSRPDRGEWFFAYHIAISNEGPKTVQLLSREWVITDAAGNEERVRGPGVVGEQPLLAPGERFQYTSACPLSTPFGWMEDTYQMVTEEGEGFDAQIGRFSLVTPYSIN